MKLAFLGPPEGPNGSLGLPADPGRSVTVSACLDAARARRFSESEAAPPCRARNQAQLRRPPRLQGSQTFRVSGGRSLRRVGVARRPASPDSRMLSPCIARVLASLVLAAAT